MDWSGVAIVVLAVCLVATLVAKRAGRPQTPSVPVRQVPLDDATAREITALLARDRTIEAIKLLRETTGSGLLEAKERIDHWDVVAPVAPAPTQSGELDALAVEARQVRDASGAIHAIKLVRERTGWGLAEAKTYVDRLG